MLSLLSYLVMPFCSEWKRLLLGGSRLPSEQLKPSLLLLHVPSSSSPFTMGLPHPLNHLTTLPLRQTDRLSHAHVHASVCTKKENLQTHTGQTGVSRLCFYAVPLSTNSDWVCVRDSGGDRGPSCSHHSRCVVFVSLCSIPSFHEMSWNLFKCLKPETRDKQPDECWGAPSVYICSNTGSLMLGRLQETKHPLLW